MFKKTVFYVCAAMLGAVITSWAVIGVKVTPDSWNIGGGQGTWTSPNFTVQNIGNEDAVVNICASNTQNWQLASAPGSNLFSLYWGDTNNWNLLYTGNSQLLQTLSPNNGYNFKLLFKSPISVQPVNLTETQISTVTVSVSPKTIGQWDIIDVTNETTNNATFAFDSKNWPYISYADASGNLRYAKWNGTGWDIQTLDTQCGSPVIAADSSYNPHIVYSMGSTIKYAKYDGSNWAISTISNESSGLISFILDNSNKAHVAYITGQRYNYKLQYLNWNGSSWGLETAWSTTSANDFPSSCSLIFDNSNMNPYIIFTVDNNGTKYYKCAKKTGSSWEIQNVDSISWGGSPNTVAALDHSNYPHFAYSDPNANAVKYASWDGSSWNIQIVSLDYCACGSLCFDQNNYAVIGDVVDSIDR